MTELPSPVTYDAAKAGEMVGQSANWMKTQARAGRIPYTRIGRSMRWTPQQVAEIIRAGEKKPETRPALVARTPRRKMAGGVPALQAKTPRRRKAA
jgi:hypothetical protein